MMSLMVFLGVIVQFYKLWVCGSGATNHRQCDMFFAPDAVDIVGRLSLYVVVYRFFFAFRVFYEAKTGIFDVVYGIHLLSVHAACTHFWNRRRENKRLRRRETTSEASESN